MNNDNNIEIVETSAGSPSEAGKKSSFKDFFKKISNLFKSNKLRNEALFKRGGYSLAITALVLAGLILFNWLVSSLANRFHLEFDMTSDQKNSISEENIDYIKNLDADVTVTICGTEEEYTDYMQYYAENYYGVSFSSSSELEYFVQTTNLIKKYPEYNKKIVVKYVDPQSTEFTAITTSYSNYSLTYGDMLVTSSVSGKEKVKVLTFNDIYVTTENSSYYYGYSYTLTANRLETALTSAIAYVTSADTKKVALLSGHSNNNYTDAYNELLTTNNYDITVISDKLITSVSNEFDAIVIAAPTSDFIGSELDVISEFLDNDGKLGKGLIFFADATCPSLPNLYEFLKQWGIAISEGIVFETDSSSYYPGSPTTLYMTPAYLDDDDITTNMHSYISVANYNVPMTICDASSYVRTATALMLTSDDAVIAPIGATEDWSEYTDDDKTQFYGVIQSVESDYDSDNNEITSYVMAFSSVEFVQSTWSSYSDVCNQDIVMACTDRAAHVGDTSMTFTSKVINNESFASDVTENGTKTVSTIFMFIIPIAVAVFGIVVFIRRRNAR